MKALIAPQEFKGSLTAAEAAAAIARGVTAARPGWVLDVLPMSDGGPGFLDAMQAALGGERVPVEVHDALLRPRPAEFLWISSMRLAVVETAQANGLVLIDPAERDARRADSFGVGELLLAAAAKRPATIIAGIGGSATTDGGHGMARALGARFLDEAGRELSPGGASLSRLASVVYARPGVFDGIDLVVASDVTSPLTGPTGAAAVFGPQKGASPSDVDALDEALFRYASVVRRVLRVDIDRVAGAGAAGGLGAGLLAFLGARIASGFDIVARVAGLEARLAAADVVVTGEGSFDVQSLAGKTTGRILALAAEHGKPCVVFAGTSSRNDPNVRALDSLEPDLSRSMANARALLEGMARDRAAAWP